MSRPPPTSPTRQAWEEHKQEAEPQPAYDPAERMRKWSDEELWAGVDDGWRLAAEVLIERAVAKALAERAGGPHYIVKSIDGQWFLTPAGMAQNGTAAMKFNTTAAAEAARMAYLANSRWDGPAILVTEGV